MSVSALAFSQDGRSLRDTCDAVTSSFIAFPIYEHIIRVFRSFVKRFEKIILWNLKETYGLSYTHRVLQGDGNETGSDTKFLGGGLRFTSPDTGGGKDCAG